MTSKIANRPVRSDMVNYLKNQVLGEKRFNVQQKPCRIISVSPQGDILYAVARYPDQTITKPDGRVENLKGVLVGNEGEIEEKNLLMAEILIPTDIDLSKAKGLNLRTLIGAQAMVEVIDQRPIKIITLGLNANARNIDSSLIRIARSLTPDKSLGKDSQVYLESQGYSKPLIREILAEAFIDKFENKVLVYGNTALWNAVDQESVKKNSDYVDMTSYNTRLASVYNLPASALKKKICWNPPIIFSAVS